MNINKDKISELKKIDGNGFFKKNPYKLFGSENHKYLLNKCLSEFQIETFERINQIQLPSDYRDFLKNIGNGGIGPAYGLYRLEDWNLELDIENNNFLMKKFPYQEKWNSYFDINEEIEDYTESEEFQNWELEYYSEKHIYGSIRICHYGCAIYYFLVVSGIEKGNIWVDDRANDAGIYPLSSENKTRYNFTEWYNKWLDESLRKLKETK